MRWHAFHADMADFLNVMQMKCNTNEMLCIILGMIQYLNTTDAQAVWRELSEHMRTYPR